LFKCRNYRREGPKRLRQFDIPQQKTYYYSQILVNSSFWGTFVGRLKYYTSYLFVPIAFLALQGCNGLGYQGGSIPTDFTGIGSAQAISPQTVQLNWTAYPGALKYNVYAANENDPLYTPSFNSILFQPVPYSPSATYQYSVTAVDPSTGNEEGLRSDYSSVQLLPHFNFQTSGNVKAASQSSLTVSWTAYPSVSYLVYVAPQLPTGLVNYNEFTSPTTTVSGLGSAVVTGLSPGTQYCAIVVASYADQTNDDPVGNLFKTAVSTTLSSNAYLVGPSGTFGDSVIAQSQKCARTQSNFSVAGLKIYTQKASLSAQPTFYVAVPGVAVGTASTVSTSIYQVNGSTGLATAIGSKVGTGIIAAQTAIPSGRYQFYAVVSDLTSTAQAPVEINVGPTGATPTSSTRPWVYVRAFNGTENPSAPTGYYPQKQQDGFGVQNAGSSVAIGDFNCDGVKDIAIGIPNASIMAADNRPAENGAVIVYYGVSTGTPATATTTNPPPAGQGYMQKITFDITSYAGDSGRNLQLGTSLKVGNFNADTQATNQYGAGLSTVYQCDDLAISSGYGPLFVLYGTRDIFSGGNVVTHGGLNYTSPTSYTVNPSSSCDPSANVCQVGVYTGMNTYVNIIGNHMTTGDYDGDGYADLAATSWLMPSNAPGGVWVFRGSVYGLVSPLSYTAISPNNTGDSIATSTGNFLGFPYIPSAITGFTTTTASGISTIHPAPPPTGNWGTSPGFGSSISTLHNAYYDTDSTMTYGSKRIRDVLLIGNPNATTVTTYTAGHPLSNIVQACIPKSIYGAAYTASYGIIGSSNDAAYSLYWDCSTAITSPTDPATNKPAVNFGSSMADLHNPLLYEPDQFEDPTCTSSNVWLNAGVPNDEGYGNCSTNSINLGYPGGVAIGNVDASGASGGAFIYYGVNNPQNYTPLTTPPVAADRNTLGFHRNQYLWGGLTQTSVLLGSQWNGTSYATPQTVTTGNACTISTIASNYYETCNIQKIQHPTSPSGSFGQVVSAFPGNVANDSITPKDTILAIAAPYRPLTLSNGNTYSAVGLVQIYQQNAQFSTNPIIVQPANNYVAAQGTSSSNQPCSTSPTNGSSSGSGGICRYSNGFSNTLTTEFDYDGPTVANNIHFGLGGIVGGPLFPGSGTYNTNSDILVGVPGEVANPAIASGTPPNVVDNGAGLVFFSHSGTYRNFEITDSGAVPSAWHALDQSFSQESNMKFHQAISIGDINQDGIGDVAVRINQGSQNFIRIYNGSSTQVGFNATAGNFTTFQVQSDPSAGIRFVPLGNITNTFSPSFLVSGATASYIFFDSIGGLVQGFPTAFGAGGTPRTLSAPFTGAQYDSNYPKGTSNGWNYLGFGDGSFYNSENPSSLSSTLTSYVNFASGDFNGDGYPDFAIGFNGNQVIADESNSATNCAANPVGGNPGYYCGSPGWGRVMIFYGGADNGFQTQPDPNGGYPLTGAVDNPSVGYFADYSADAAYHSDLGPPCTTAGTNCKIQMISEGTTAVPTTNFGSTLASVPVGNCYDSSGNPHPVNALVVTAMKSTGPALYTYRPKCLDNTNHPADFSGLISYADGTTAPATLTLPSTATTTVGITMTSVTNLMGSAPANSNILSHLVVADQQGGSIYVYPVLTFSTSAYTSFENPANSASFATDTTFTGNGGRLINYATSTMLAGTNGTLMGFGNGLASIGDVNGDGYSDIGISISSLPRQSTSSQTLNQGTVLVLFGGPGGLQSHTSSTFTTAIAPSQTASCYISPTGSSPTSVCNPQLLFVPEPTNSLRDGAYELSYLSPFAAVSTAASTNESLGTFLFGVPGRDSLDTIPTQRILQGGAFYVLP